MNELRKERETYSKWYRLVLTHWRLCIVSDTYKFLFFCSCYNAWGEKKWEGRNDCSIFQLVFQIKREREGERCVCVLGFSANILLRKREVDGQQKSECRARRGKKTKNLTASYNVNSACFAWLFFVMKRSKANTSDIDLFIQFYRNKNRSPHVHVTSMP